MDDQQEEGQLVVVLSLALPSHNERLVISPSKKVKKKGKVSCHINSKNKLIYEAAFKNKSMFDGLNLFGLKKNLAKSLVDMDEKVSMSSV